MAPRLSALPLEGALVMPTAQDSWPIQLPDNARTTNTLAGYLAHNAVFNVLDYYQAGDGQ